MKVEILTIFPELFSDFLKTSLIGKASGKNLLSVKPVNIREFADPPHFKVDDTPYGGGAGMVLKPEPLFKAVCNSKKRLPSAPVILLSPAGERFNQDLAVELSSLEELILVCGRYEGVDQRFIDSLVDREISIGDYVLMGGEVPAMVVLEAAVRQIKGVLGNELSVENESFGTGSPLLLEAPQYTKPAEFMGQTVPKVLLSGDHEKINKWRKEQAAVLTKARRPDLLTGHE